MHNPLRVLWTEGMLVTPQHLQQQDAYHELLVASRLDALEPLAWGTLRVAIDAKALRSETVALEAIEVVMPDGTPLALDPGHPELPPSRPVQGHFPANQTTLEVHLALPRERQGVPSTGAKKGGATRFVRTERTVGDLQAEADGRELAFSQRNPVLLFGSEKRDDYVSLKIAELVRDDANNLVVSDPYVPPCIRISASPFLMSGVRRLFTVMRTRRSALVEVQRERDGSTVEYNAADVTRFLLLNAINTHLPLVRHLAEAGDVHPRVAYLMLSQLVGELASFGSNFDPVDLAPFAFTDLRASFEGLFARILSLLHATVQESFVALDLIGREDGMFFGELSDSRWPNCQDFYLAVRSASLGDQELGQQLPRLAKIASWQDIHSILTAASPGAATQVTYRPPPQLPVRAGVTYFQVQSQNDFWRNITAQKQIALYLPRPFEPARTEVRLLGVLR